MPADWPRVALGEVLRRSGDRITLDPETMYSEVTVKLWGNGVSERRRVLGAEAVARPEDAGRFGSHRFITCRPVEGVATSRFLFFHFSTEDGLNQLREASQGGAGRNRTLGLEALGRIPVPVPRYEG